MRCLPRMQIHDSLALVHATPENLWRSPGPESSDAELEQAFAALRKELVVFGHIHRPFIRGVRTRSSQTAEASACLMMAIGGRLPPD